MAVILGLPDHLQQVPYDIEHWRPWRDEVLAYRVAKRLEAERDDRVKITQRALCAQDPKYWLTMYGWVYEPRVRYTAAGQSGGDMPAIPYGFQADLMDWFMERLNADPYQGRLDNDGVISKSRDSTVSWTMAALYAWLWTFHDPFSGLMLSRNETYVDSNDPKSLFWKVLYVLGVNNRAKLSYPDWLLPTGWDPLRHHSKDDMVIRNPENGNTIVGESTNRQAGRGGRFTCAVLDEFAFMANGQNIWTVLRSATDHRYAVSTESFDQGTHHWDLWHSLKANPETAPSVLEINWWDHPEHDDAWFAMQQREDQTDPGKFAAEVLRDPYQAFGGWYYPFAREIATIGFVGDYPYDPDKGDVVCAIDPGIGDETAVIWFQHEPHTAIWNVIEAYQRTGMPTTYYVGLLTGWPQSGWQLNYDADAFDVMELTRTISHRITYCGDPAGNQRSIATGDSPYSKLYEHGITVIVHSSNGANLHRNRRETTMELLPRLRWNQNSPRVLRALDLIKDARFVRKSDNSPKESGEPVHDATSHFRSALEYFAIFESQSGQSHVARRGPYQSERYALLHAPENRIEAPTRPQPQTRAQTIQRLPYRSV